MGKAVAITRLDMTVADLRAAATRAKNASAARRMLCLALVLEGSDRTTSGCRHARPSSIRRGCRGIGRSNGVLG